MTSVDRAAGVAAQWVADGERWFADRLSALADDRFDAPSRLPGWTRAHVVAHVARNADALARLVEWARTGVETPMYPDPDARAREIEAGAALPAAVLRAEAAESAARLAQAWGELPAGAWSVRVRSALGRDIPVSESVWLRVREVWVHGVDLGAGGRVEDLPVAVATALLDDAVDTLTRRGAPEVLLVATDSDYRRRFGPAEGDTAPVQVRASTHRLLAWVLGRETAPGPAAVPTLPRWL